MKTLSSRPLLIAAAVASLFTLSCKKKPINPGTLRGLWESSRHADPSITFFGDSVFYYVWLMPTDVRPVKFKGTYTTQRSSLATQFAAVSFNGITAQLPEFKPSLTAPGFYTLFDNASYKLQGNQLIIEYTAYPAGQPQPSTITFFHVFEGD